MRNFRKIFPAAALAVAACSSSPGPAREPTTAPAARGAAAETPAPESPDASVFAVVRDDFFAGLRGDAEALDRAMDVCEEMLAEDPDHAEALVWHGAGLTIRAGAAFDSGDPARGRELWRQGLAEMDRAAQLAPNDVAVRIPRGATLLTISRFVPDAMGKSLLQKGVGDYERAYEIQAGHLDSLSLHARGQLLYGLADGWDRLGDGDLAERYYRELREERETSPYRERAEAWLAGDPRPPEDVSECGACHAR